MEIVTQESPDRDVIAREMIDDEPYGEFYLSPSGEVRYRYEEAGYDLFANTGFDHFLAAVTAWRRYRAEVREAKDENGERRVVEALKAELESAESGLSLEQSFWAAIVEQAEDGML